VATVLIADDDADHRELMTLALNRFGHHVAQAEDTHAAERIIAAGGIDVVLLDVRMPGESGIDLCRRLRAAPATAGLAIMFVTADVNDRRILAAMEAGADDYLTKPFHRTELCTRLDNLLLRRTASPFRPAATAQAAMLAARHAMARPVARARPLHSIA
jgi:DNA-binding response OmpR family regulator